MTIKDMPSGKQTRELKGRIIGIPEGGGAEKAEMMLHYSAQCRNDGLRNLTQEKDKTTVVTQRSTTRKYSFTLWS
jgi:hypothetical protein